MPEHFPQLIVLAFVLLEVVALLYDVWSLTIPNPVTYGIASLFLIGGLLDPGAVAWLDHLAAGLLVLAICVALFAFRIIGGGDVKLYAATALWFGLSDLPGLLLLVGIAGIALAIVLLSVRNFVPMVAGHLPEHLARYVPRSLLVGEGVPYGVAIAGSAIALAF